MRLRIIVPKESSPSLMEKVNAWNAETVLKDESGHQLSLVCEIEPSILRDCDALSKCSTCNAFIGDVKQYRVHLKSEWHKHNLRRKTRQLPPLTADECLASVNRLFIILSSFKWDY
ncbi:hypothetical protein MKW98_032360 [Papaver atlanticum]|uniref:Ribosome maturation protein SDO1/SBDS C-terminal domain-containing protein n=1 Tax=Papaver atlanticum TaxID=357466 RepID=A0AAD4XDM5_9MAGN|nr:hypothetical protein MKW98_032360 [Papaver atlanticum]